MMYRPGGPARISSGARKKKLFHRAISLTACEVGDILGKSRSLSQSYMSTVFLPENLALFLFLDLYLITI